MKEDIFWVTVKIRIGNLINLDINPRKISIQKKDLLKKSLDKFNLVDTPVINLDNTIISGNQRVKSLISTNGLDFIIDVRKPNRMLTNSELKQYVLIANTHYGEFDFDVLEKEFYDTDLSLIDLEIKSFNKEIFTREINNVEKKDLQKFPLSIVLSKQELIQWEQIKNNEKINDDTKCFIKIVLKP